MILNLLLQIYLHQLKKAGGIGKGVADTINGFVKKTDCSLIGNTIAQGINTGIIFANKFVKNLEYKEIGKSLSEGINSTIINIQYPSVINQNLVS